MRRASTWSGRARAWSAWRASSRGFPRPRVSSGCWSRPSASASTWAPWWRAASRATAPRIPRAASITRGQRARSRASAFPRRLRSSSTSSWRTPTTLRRREAPSASSSLRKARARCSGSRTTGQRCPARWWRASSIRWCRCARPSPRAAALTWAWASTSFASSPNSTAGACARETSAPRAARDSKSRCFCRKLLARIDTQSTGWKFGPHRTPPHHRFRGLPPLPRLLPREHEEARRARARRCRGHGRVRALRSAPAAQRRSPARGRVLLRGQSALQGAMSAMADNVAVEPRRASRSPFIVEADDTTWRTLAVLCTYRMVLAIFVAGAFAFLNRFFNFGIRAPSAVLPGIVSYTVASVILFVPARLREPSLSLQVTAGIVVDVVAIVMLMYASGGVRSGLGVLLLVSLAPARLITRGRLVFFHAAIAAIAIPLEQTVQISRYHAGGQDFVQAGITSAAFFATAGLASALARYARTSEEIAEERKIDLANLSQINELVIRDMQDGILVVDGNGRIRQNNPRAIQLLGALPPGRWPLISEYTPEIAALLDAWRRGSETTFMQLRTPRSAGELQVHFVPIGAGNPAPTVVFVEDVGRMRQQAQQMKLAALRRLTASIAHEIRNPLSSIGHAAELLDEDPRLNDAALPLIET